MNYRKPTEQEINRAKEVIREDKAEDFGGYVCDFWYYLTDPERKAFSQELAKEKGDDAELGRLFRLGFNRGLDRSIDIEAFDKASQWVEYGERV